MTEQISPITGPAIPFHYTDADTGLTYTGTITDTGDGVVVDIDDGEFNEDVEDNGEAGNEED